MKGQYPYVHRMPIVKDRSRLSSEYASIGAFVDGFLQRRPSRTPADCLIAPVQATLSHVLF